MSAFGGTVRGTPPLPDGAITGPTPFGRSTQTILQSANVITCLSPSAVLPSYPPSMVKTEHCSSFASSFLASEEDLKKFLAGTIVIGESPLYVSYVDLVLAENTKREGIIGYGPVIYYV